MMPSSSEQIRGYAGPALFSFGFRPFFLSAAVVASVVPLIAAASLGGGVAIGGAGGPIAYHGHEMVFGYLGAVIAGFILTAVPNWTGRLPIVGPRLAAIFALWLAGRAAMFCAGLIGSAAAALIEAPFLVVLAFVVWREVLAGKSWRNLPVCLLLTLFAAGNLVWHLTVLQGGAGGAGSRVGAGVVAMLIALIGGRITPSFTRNWLAKAGRPAIETGVGRLDKAALVCLAVGAVLYVVAPATAPTGWVLIAAAALLLARMARWRGWSTVEEPLVTILHAGYLWLSLSVFLIGLSIIAPAAMAPSAALHALTAGAAGVMTLAVMTRATLGHTGRPLRADGATTAIYILVNVGAAMRVAAPYLPIDYAAASGLAGAIWGGAFALFAVVYGRYLVAPRR